MKKLFLLSLVMLFLVGCAGKPQPPIHIDQSYWEGQERTVGIVMTDLPETDVHIYGAGCLLCLLVAEAANSNLSTHTETLSDENLTELKGKIAKDLEEGGIKTSIINEAITLKSLPKNKSSIENASKFDFSSYKNTHNISHLLVIEINQLGMTRGYSSYVPITDPRAIFKAKSYLVDLETNIYDSYYSIDIEQNAHENWDESPTFPALTNAYYQALAKGKDSIIDSVPVPN